jgi:hypothetical protein
LLLWCVTSRGRRLGSFVELRRWRIRPADFRDVISSKQDRLDGTITTRGSLGVCRRISSVLRRDKCLDRRDGVVSDHCYFLLQMGRSPIAHASSASLA